MQFKGVIDGGYEGNSPVAGKFLHFFEKNKHFNVIWNTFRAFFKAIENP